MTTEPNSEQIARLRAERDLEHEGRLFLVDENKKLQADMEKARAERDELEKKAERDRLELIERYDTINAHEETIQELLSELAQAREVLKEASEILTELGWHKDRGLLQRVNAALSSPSPEKSLVSVPEPTGDDSCPVCGSSNFIAKSSTPLCPECERNQHFGPSSEPGRGK